MDFKLVLSGLAFLREEVESERYLLKVDSIPDFLVMIMLVLFSGLSCRISKKLGLSRLWLLLSDLPSSGGASTISI